MKILTSCIVVEGLRIAKQRSPDLELAELESGGGPSCSGCSSWEDVKGPPMLNWPSISPIPQEKQVLKFDEPGHYLGKIKKKIHCTGKRKTRTMVDEAVGKFFQANPKFAEGGRILLVSPPSKEVECWAGFLSNKESVFSRTVYDNGHLEVCESLPFADGEFDQVWSNQVLEHTVKPWKCLQEMNRVLKTGGVVINAAPAFYPIHTNTYPDNYRYNPEGMKALHVYAGMKILTAGGWGSQVWIRDMVTKGPRYMKKSGSVGPNENSGYFESWTMAQKVSSSIMATKLMPIETVTMKTPEILACDGSLKSKGDADEEIKKLLAEQSLEVQKNYRKGGKILMVSPPDSQGVECWAQWLENTSEFQVTQAMGSQRLCESLTASDNSFDQVWAPRSLHHTEYPWECFAEMARVVKPGGIVIVTAPSFGSRSKINFHPGGLKSLAESGGLKVVKAGGYGNRQLMKDAIEKGAPYMEQTGGGSKLENDNTFYLSAWVVATKP